ncbi:MAG: TonB-dependent receptor, partial [Bacteroidota bacterium]
MKLTVLLLTVGFFSLQANTTYSQKTKISLDLTDVSIQQVLDKIESDTEFRFFVNVDEVNVDEQLTIKVQDKTIDRVLKRIFKNQNIGFKVLDKQIVLSSVKTKPPVPETIVQEWSVTGTVLDNEGAPLPGASIVEKGTTNGTQTDFDGNFSIDVTDENAILTISYLGFLTKDVPVEGQTDLTITMKEDAAGLDEVIVVGYGTQSRAKVTTAVSQVKGKELVKSANINLGTSLSGQLPGLIITNPIGEPGNDDPTIFIRGLSTVTGENEPLIVIDGVANADGINRLDPNDIETFTVLKDASAAIYGAQSAAGVILITTKRGRTGKTEFNFSTSYGLVSPFGEAEFSDAALQLRGLGFSDEVIQPWLDGTNQSTDWMDEVLKSSSGQQRHSLTARGGSEKVNYFMSLGLSTQEGRITGDEQSGNDQYNIRSNIDAQLTDRLKLRLDFSGRRQDRTLLARTFEENIRNSGFTTPLQPAYVQGLPSIGRLGQSALSVAKSDGNRKTTLDVFNSTLGLEYDIPFLEGLSFETWGNIVTTQQFGKDFLVPYIYYEEDAEGNLIEITTDRPFANPRLTERFDRSTSLTYNARLKYRKSFGDHSIDAFIAYEQNTLNSNFTQAARLDFESTAVPELFAGTTNPDLITNDGSSDQGARQNYFGQVSYDYKGKYLVQAHLRRDASERFSQAERVGYFPGLSAGWVVSKEKFFAMPAIDWLKLRGSWGILGNDAIGRFNFLSLYDFSEGYVFDGSQVVAGVSEGTLGAPNTTWEKKETINLGLELGLFNSKVSLEFDYFNNTTSDILITRDATVTDVSGIGDRLPDENLGEFVNKGFEILATYRENIGDFNFNISGNFTSVRNETIFIDEPMLPEARAHQSREGRPWGTPLMYVVEGRFLSQADIDDPTKLGLGTVALGDWIYKDINEDGIINNDDRVISDYSNIPQVTAGLNLNANYKGIDLTINAFANARVRKFIDRYISGEINNTPAYYFRNLYYSEEEPGTIPALNRGRIQPNTFWEQDASFVRIRSIELGYSLPEK